MIRQFGLALLAIAYFLVVPATPARAGGQLPDIRGLSFVYPFQGVTFFAGTSPGSGTSPTHSPTRPLLKRLIPPSRIPSM